MKVRVIVWTRNGHKVLFKGSDAAYSIWSSMPPSLPFQWTIERIAKGEKFYDLTARA